MRLFALDLEATKVAQLTGVSRRTVNRFFQAVRICMVRDCEQHAPIQGTVEIDESYFGRRRVRGKRGRGAGGKTIVFGIFKRNGRVYTQIVPNAKRATLRAIIRGRVAVDSVIHSDGWLGYDAWSTSDTGNTFASSIVTQCSSSGAAVFTSTALRASGVRPTRVWQNGAASDASTSIYISKNVNFDSTTGAVTSIGCS